LCIFRESSRRDFTIWNFPHYSESQRHWKVETGQPKLKLPNSGSLLSVLLTSSFIEPARSESVNSGLWTPATGARLFVALCHTSCHAPGAIVPHRDNRRIRDGPAGKFGS
jgi:hypothetical protein